ncbi:unnamed protein product [Lasius platythorax]|uniref:Uncharacterized protein n=1 Tax=Lasius platythorax TaxID=488582 RepID=A0AAV2NRP9_9HYME
MQQADAALITGTLNIANWVASRALKRTEISAECQGRVLSTRKEFPSRDVEYGDIPTMQWEWNAASREVGVFKKSLREWKSSTA